MLQKRSKSVLIGYFSSLILLYCRLVTLFYLSLIKGRNKSFNEILVRKMMRMGGISEKKI